jgi:hypothetical protein
VTPLALMRGGAPLRTGLEELALTALDTSAPRVTRLLAQSIVADDARLLQLWNLRPKFAPLVCEVELATGRRLWWDQVGQRWTVVRLDEL